MKFKFVFLALTIVFLVVVLFFTGRVQIVFNNVAEAQSTCVSLPRHLRTNPTLHDSAVNGGNVWCPVGKFMCGAQNVNDNNRNLDMIWCCDPA